MQVALEQIAALSFFSYVGYGLRYASSRFTASTSVLADESPIYGDFYANLLGSFWMGTMVAQKASFAAPPQRSALYLGLTTGLAGSLTTFSAWNASASLGVWHARISVHVFFMQLVISLGMSILAYIFGLHVIRLWHFLLLIYRSRVAGNAAVDVPSNAAGAGSQEDHRQEAGGSSTARGTCIYIALGVAYCALTAVWLALFFTVIAWRPLWFAFLVAPLGTLARFYLSLHNKRFRRLPLFTLLVNVSGTLLYDGLLLLWHSQTRLFSLEFRAEHSRPVLWLVPALASGFCGCYTTVSTFVHELQHLATHRAYIYAVASVVLTQLLLSAMNGPYFL